MQLASPPELSVMALFMSADMVGKSVIILLLLFSVFSWSIIISKLLTIRSVKANMNFFDNLYRSGHILDELYDKVKGNVNNPLASVFVSAMSECKRGSEDALRKSPSARISYKERILQAMYLCQRREMNRLESNLSFLATVGSASPFIGLFGTVWGIMHSFTSIAAMQNTSLAVVAPGIAEALLATAIGLFVAIPASIFYNYLINEVDKTEGHIQDFIGHLHGLISRTIDDQT